MKTALKAAAALCVLALLAVMAAPLALRHLLPPERVRGLVVREAAEALGREVRLEGADWSLLHGLTLRGVAVSETPDFAAGTFAEVREFRMRPGWRALLRGRLAVTTVSAEGLRLSLVRVSPGAYNFSDIAGSTASAPGGAVPLALSIHRASVSDGRVSYKDPASKTDLVLAGIEAEVRGFSFTEPFDAELSLRASGAREGRSLEAALRGAARLDPGGGDPRKAGADVSRLAVESGGLSLEASGRIAGLEEPEFDLAFSLSRDKAQLVSGLAEGRARLPDSQGGLRVSARFKAKAPGAPAAALRGLGLPEGLALPPGAGSGAVELRGDSLSVQGLRLESDHGSVTASGTVAGLGTERPAADLALEADLKLPALAAVDLPFLPLPAGLTLPATAAKGSVRLQGEDASVESLSFSNRLGSLSASGRLRRLRAPRPDLELDSSFELDLPAFADSDLPWAGLPKGLAAPAMAVKGTARLKGDTVTVPSLRVRTEAGALEVAGALRRILSAEPEPDLSVSAKLSLPAFSDSDLPWAGLPRGFRAPAAAVAARARVKGRDLEVESLEVGTSAGTVRLSGRVRGALAGKPEPELDASAKLDLPAFKTDDFAWAGLPPGLSLPASKVEGSLWASLDEARIRSVRVVAGKNDVELDGGKVVGLRSGKPLFNLLVKCRSFSLDELGAYSQGLSDLNLTGGGFFAVGITGRLPKPILEGKAQFRGLGATAGALALSGFTGTATMNERRLDIPDLKGKLNDGELSMDLTVKDYATRPDVDLAAELTRFDLGAFLQARAAVVGPKEGSAPLPGAEPAPPMDLKGRLVVGSLVHDNAEAKEIRVEWQLTEATPDLKGLGGWAKLHSGSGKFTDLGRLATQSKIVKVLVMPLLLFQKVGRLGGVRLFPDFNNVSYSELSGSYRFEKGVMTLEESRIMSSAFNVTAAGTIDLPAETQDLLVTAQVANVAPMDVEVKGSFEKPQTKAKVGRFIKDLIIRK